MLRAILMIIILFLTGCSNTQNLVSEEETEVGYVGEKVPVSRAEVAKMLALSRYTPEEVNNLERIITFEDTDINKWYDKYINAAFTAKLISGTNENYFSPNESLSLEQAQLLVKKLNTSGNFELKYNEADKDKPISYKVWLEAFSKAAANKVSQCDIFIYGTKKQCEELGDNYILCNGGLRSAEGIDITPYSDKIVKVLMKDTEILGIVNVVNSSPTLKNSEILDVDGNNITIQLNGATRKFSIENSENQFKSGDRVDITFDNSNKYQITLSN